MATSVSFKKATPAAAPQAPAPAAQTIPVTPTQAAAGVIEVKATPVPATVPAATVPATSNAPTITTTTAAPQPVTSSAVVAQGPQMMDVPDEYAGIGGFEGEFTSKDMATPYLSIMGKTTKGFEEHPEWLGQWVYDKSVPLGKEIKVVFVRATKWHIEDRQFGDPVIPQRFAKMEHARAAGFNESQLKDGADLDLLIEVDASIEGVADLAHILEGDKGYILCRYGVRSTAYGKTVGILTKDASGFLKGNLINGFYRMESTTKTSPKGTYYVPVLKTEGKTTEGLRRQIIDRMGNA